MYLFTRQVQLGNGAQIKGLEGAIGITEKVNQITSINAGLWSPIVSPNVGLLSWGCAVESIGDLEDADAKLLADPMYLDAVEQGAAFTTGVINDRVAQYIDNPTADPNATHVAVVEAQLANGAFAHGMEVGVQIAQKATKIGGQPTAFLLGTTGAYAACAWITSATSIRALEAAEQKVNGDAKFIALLDKEAAGCFVEGAATQSIWRRVV